MSGRKRKPQTTQEGEHAPDWTPPTEEELTGGAPPPADPNPADTIKDLQNQVEAYKRAQEIAEIKRQAKEETEISLKKVLAKYGLTDLDQITIALDNTKDLQNQVETLKRQAKEDTELHDKTDETKKELEGMKTRVQYAEQVKALKSINPDTSMMDMTLYMMTLDKIGQPKDDGTKAELAAIRQQLAAAEKERAQADAKHAQEIADMKHAQERAEDKRAQELKEMQHAREQEAAEQRRAQELAELRNGLMQQVAGLQAKIDATSSRPPGALGAIGEIKQMITDANNLKAALKELGLGGEGGKDSLAGAMVDKLLGSVMKLAKTAGVENWLSGVTGEGQQAAGPPPAPEDRPPTQDEFDQASVEWFRVHGSTVKPGQIKMTDDGFLIGNGPEIQTYIKMNPRTTGIQPCISQEGLYMVPPNMSKAYLDWIRSMTAQAQGGAPPPTKKQGDNNVRPGF